MNLVSYPTYGQGEAEDWSRPVNLSESEAQSTYPSIAADPAGGIHVIWEEGEGQDDVIVYTRREGGRWTKPVDILINPGGGAASYPVLAADAYGYLHVVWKGGGTVYYSHAYAPVAGSARHWSEPKPLTSPDLYLNFPTLSVAPDGVLHAAYAKQIGPDSGIYALRSTDRGEKWSPSTAIYQNPRADRLVDKPRLAAGPDGVVHAVWVESRYPEVFPPLGLRYARSTDGGNTWSQPLVLADGPYDDPAILTLGRELHVVYSGTAEDRFKFHRWSSDGGRTWSDAWRDPEVGGLLGWPALVADGDRVLHWLMAGSIFEAGTDGLYYTTWSGESWTSGQVLLYHTSRVAQNMANISAAVSLGNELHVVVQVPLARKEGGGWQFDVFYLHRPLGASGRPPQTLPAPTERPSPTPTPSPRPTAMPTALPAGFPRSGFALPSPDASMRPLVIGLLSVLAFLGLFLVLRRRGKKV